MLSRIATVALLVCAALALAVTAQAGECEKVVFFFEQHKDTVNVINLETTVPPGFASWRLRFHFLDNNNGATLAVFEPDVSVGERFTITAKDLYNNIPAAVRPAISDTYVLANLSLVPPGGSPGRFSATLKMRDATRELLCVTLP